MLPVDQDWGMQARATPGVALLCVKSSANGGALERLPGQGRRALAPLAFHTPQGELAMGKEAPVMVIRSPLAEPLRGFRAVKRGGE